MRSGLVIVTVALGCCWAATAEAAFPGTNGKITFSQNNSIYTMNADGSGEQVFLANPPRRNDGAWSPDGTKMVYRKGQSGNNPELAVVNADGTNDHLITSNTYAEFDPAWSADGTRVTYWAQPVPSPEFDNRIFVVDATGGPSTQLTDTPKNGDPSWSPDGSKIAWWHASEGLADIWTMSPDGSNAVNVTNTPALSESDIDWSPDGSRIAFRGGNFEGTVDDLRVMNADGTNAVIVADPSGPVFGVNWSPDGTKIAYNAGGDIYVVNVDGTGNTLIRSSAVGSGVVTDWRPIPVNGYPRPKGATPVRVSLVPSYSKCTAPNRLHGPPLAEQACSPPAQQSGELTVGTPDSNGEDSNARAFVRYQTLVGDPSTPADEADARITVELLDIYEQGTFIDYGGEVRARASLRITDKQNQPYPGGPQAGTVSDTELAVTVPCDPTVDPAVGATCAVSTTADALAPGTVAEGRRAIWALGQVRVDGGGADGDADTPADNTPFMTQGVFVP